MPGDIVYSQKESTPLKEIDTRGESMNNWEFIKVADYKGYSSFYSEKNGLISNISISCYPVDKDGKRFQSVYANYNPNDCKKSSSLYLVNRMSFDLDTIVDLTFYRRKTQQQNYYGSIPNSIQEANAEKIDEVKYSVTISYSVVCLDSSGNATTTSKSQSLIIIDKSELQDIMVWATKDEVKSYIMPVLMDLQDGQKYYYIEQGICEVVEVYDYPIKHSNIICKVVFANGTEKDIAIGDKCFVYIPLDYKSELLQFNESKNELKLQPILQVNQGYSLINVMWQPIEDAARYVVKLYRYVNTENRRKVYFLKDYEVDRNEHFLSINDLIVNGHIIVVIAESRSGEIVAQSRGIDVAKGEPKLWN